MTAKVINMSIRYVFLKKDGGAIYLVYNPRSKRILKQWSPFSNGDQLLMRQDIGDTLAKLLAQGWEYCETGEYE